MTQIKELTVLNCEMFFFLTKAEESVRCRALCDITKSSFSELDDLAQSFGQLEQEEVKGGIFSFLWVHTQAKEADHLKYEQTFATPNTRWIEL